MTKQSGSRASRTVVFLAVLAAVLLLLFLGASRLPSLAVETDSSDITEYERILAKLGHPQTLGTGFFPASIPAGAEGAQMHYFSSISTTLCLKYSLDRDALSEQIARFSEAATWIGSPAGLETAQTGILESMLLVLDYEEALPRDLTLYLMVSRPYREGDWNHGTLGLCAISEERGEILFLYEDW